MSSDAADRFRTGMRAAVPAALAGGMAAFAFAIVARQIGFSAFEAVAMSALCLAGGAQFAAVGVLAAGGTVPPAVLAAALMNARFLAMGAAIAPSLPGRWHTRALQGQAVIDASWALSARGDGTFDRWVLFGATALQYVTWTGGTAAGALGSEAISDPAALGLDAILPAFLGALLVAELRGRHSARVVAVIAALTALALVPLLPPGLPLLVASATCLLGLLR